MARVNGGRGEVLTAARSTWPLDPTAAPPPPSLWASSFFFFCRVSWISFEMVSSSLSDCATRFFASFTAASCFCRSFFSPALPAPHVRPSHGGRRHREEWKGEKRPGWQVTVGKQTLIQSLAYRQPHRHSDSDSERGRQEHTSEGFVVAVLGREVRLRLENDLLPGFRQLHQLLIRRQKALGGPRVHFSRHPLPPIGLHHVLGRLLAECA